MPTTFKKPSEIFADFKTTFKSLKPEINVDDPSQESIVRGRVLAGIESGLYGDQLLVDNDTYAADAREEALTRKGADYNLLRQPATASSSSDVLFTGPASTNLNVGQVLRYDPTGIFYTLQATITFDISGNAHGVVTANTSGQVGNVSAGNLLTLVSPPPGVGTTATLVAALQDGSDIETLDSYRSRILNFQQRRPSGGNEFDYPNFAFTADPSVRSAFIRRFGRGLGTVDVYITTGTTDIDTAITQGQSITRIPSGTTITNVQTYYDQNAPLTDCPRVFAPIEVTQDVTVKVDLASGLTLTSIVANATFNPLNLNVGDIIKREISRVLYKVPIGGRKIPGQTNGFVVASDIELQLDVMLSAVTQGGTSIGNMAILTDRQVQNLDGLNVNRALNANELVIPGTLVVTVGV